VPEGEERDEAEINLEQELFKLRKIKELLNSKAPVVEEGAPQEEPAGEVAEEEKEEGREEAEPEAGKPEEPESGPEGEGEPTPPEQVKKETPGEGGEEEQHEPAAREGEGEKVPEAEEKPGETSFQDIFQKLEAYRQGTVNENNGEVSYFEYGEKMVIDGEYLIATLNDSFEEAKKLYIRLSQTESPKDQFFIKQEIIKQQEILRKVMLRSIRLCEKENCSLPEYTRDVLNIDVLKTILEKVSMENWSNQDDFASFDNFSKELKDTFYTRITPPTAYLESIMQQLGIDS